jgi:colicin import membrane protein
LTTEKKYRMNGLLGTFLFHLAILMILIFLGFTTKLPLPGEEGVEVSLGYDLTGSGIVQPRNTAPAEQTTQSRPVTERVEEDVVTQDIEPVPDFVQKKEEKKIEEVVEKPEKEVIEKKPEVNPAALYQGKSKDQSQQQSEGITPGDGDQGKPTGTVDSKQYLGQGGFGEGMSYSLEGRDPRYLPKPSSQFQENGTVVVQITVDRYGNVARAVAIDKGSNTTSTTLRRLAEEAAIKARFNVNTSAAEFQRGTITYHFVVKN